MTITDKTRRFAVLLTILAAGALLLSACVSRGTGTSAPSDSADAQATSSSMTVTDRVADTQSESAGTETGYPLVATGEHTMRELHCTRDSLDIFGQIYLPGDGTGSYPTVIIGHGIGGSYSNNVDNAEYFADHGIAAYVFDFIGGSTYTMSDGSMQEMSVLTETADMAAVLDELKGQPFVDGSRVFLMGESQGGCVAALAALDHASEIAGLVLVYPAFCIPDYVHQAFGSLDELPDTATIFGQTVGKRYFADAWNLDIYGALTGYEGDVLILHGSKDLVVPLTYSQRAAQAYPNAELVVLEGAAHGFSGTDRETEREDALAYFMKHL